MSNEKKYAINMNQINMIKVALYYEDIEMSKMLSIAQDYILVNSKANIYILLNTTKIYSKDLNLNYLLF